MDTLNVDEVVGQLLASEGFTSVEELSLVIRRKLPASKASTTRPRPNCRGRAREYLEKLEAELEPSARSSASTKRSRPWPRDVADHGEARRERGEDLEDLAGCATDDLAGWSERKDGESTRHAASSTD